MKLNLTLILFILSTVFTQSIGQSIVKDFYQVNSGNGKGIKFWSNTNYYKIHMGNATNNTFGPVTSYSIKMNMSNHASRGWVWGPYNKKPIAALNTEGNFQINGWMKIGSAKDASKTVGSGALEIAGALRIDGNEIITNANKTLYLNLDNNGDLSVDHKTLRVDASTNRVGVGTSTPRSKLTVVSEANESGIVSSNPNGTSYFPYSNGWSYLAGIGIVFRTDGNKDRMRINRDGTVKIGNVNTISGGYKLFVEQGILAEKVRVAVKNSADWADYVFEEDYKLMPLSDLRTYIKKNKKLPEIPSAEDVVENGIDMAETDALLLKKLEESHLYILELHKELMELKEVVSKLKNDK